MKINYLSNGESQINENFFGFGAEKKSEVPDAEDEWHEIFDEYHGNNGLGTFANVENFKDIVIPWPKLGSEKFTDNEKFSDNEVIGKSIEDEVVDHNNGWAHLYETYFRKNQPNTTTEQFTNA